ncbi:hypothetical protein WCP94_004298 [Bilophila wadsworthia]|nr:MAG TPA: hypothetical protein [Caudoviricetes sp.]
MLGIRRFLKTCIVAAACRDFIDSETAHRLLRVFGLIHV